jgi:hypothetical protein
MLDAMEDVVCRLWHQISKISLLRIMRGFFCSDLFQSLKNITRIPTMFCRLVSAAQMPQMLHIYPVHVVLWTIVKSKLKEKQDHVQRAASAPLCQLFQNLQ